MSRLRAVFAAFICAALALAIVQATWIAIGLAHWARSWLKGFYEFYLFLHLTLVWVAIALYLQRLKTADLRGCAVAVVYGTLVGYLAGVLAVLCTPLVQANGWARALSLPQGFDEWVGILLEPLLLLNWLFGGLVGVTAFSLVWLWRRVLPSAIHWTPSGGQAPSERG